MTDLNDLLAQIPMDKLASQLGVDEQTAEEAAREAMPALLGGMQANAQDPAGAASLAKAVTQHDPSLVEGGVDLDQVDTVDGDKIVKNVFGDNSDQVMSQLGGLPGLGGGGQGGGGMVQKLLPVLAPIVMSYLAKQFMKGGASTQAASGSGGAGGGIGDLLGGLLGGGQGGAGGGIGDLLGDLLGGGKR